MKIDEYKLREVADVSYYSSQKKWHARLAAFIGTGDTEEEALDKLRESILRNLEKIAGVLGE